MIIDTQSTFSDEQDIGQAAGSYPSTNVLDTGAADSDVGHGDPNVFIELKIKEAFAGVGATLDVQVQTSNSEGSGYATVASTGAKSVAQVNAGIDPIRLPLGLKRYIRLQYVIAGATSTAGTISAFLVKDIQRQHAFPIGHS